MLEIPARGRLLAVSDVHGNLPWLKGLLERAAFSPEDALVLVGDFLSHQYQRSLLYHPGFSTEYRTGDGSAEPGGSL